MVRLTLGSADTPTMHLLQRSFVAFSVVAAAACGGARVRPDVPAAPASFSVSTLSPNVGQPIEVREDPAAAVVARADAEFALGERELAAGRVVTAREHFDRAIDHLLALPAGARATVATSAAFDRLLDRISALELLALREGDGLAEADTEPAAIDELLSAAVFERPAPATTTAETVYADLLRSSLGLDIPPNDRVLSFVELFQGRLHEFIVQGMERGHRYLPMVRRVFAEEGVPDELIYLPLVESAFKANALSRAAARGLWQFMPATGAEYGLKQNWFIDERSDPEKATRAAAKYLKVLGRMFDGDWNLALASYNAGPGRVQRAMRQSGQSDFWRLTASTRYLPRETRDYVPMVMAAILVARNPQLYGIDVRTGSPLAYERVSVPNALDLKILAEWSGVTVEELRTLNPELRRTTTPLGAHDLRVPVGTAATIERHLASADPLFVHFNFHTVKRGETLAAIARRYRVSLAELRQANDLTARSRVRASQTLMIPQRQAQGLPTAITRTASAAPATSVAAPRSSSGGATTYRVQRGDTLYGIARRFDTTVDSIKRLNRLVSNRINIGDRLTVR
jgi:membrane-bound lytic murein transglycosylase D